MSVRRPGRLPRPRPVPTVSPTAAPTPTPSSAFTLTTNIETLPSGGVVAPARAVFTAPAGVTPQGVQANTLQSGDVLNGSGQQNVLNATFVNGVFTTASPTINNIPTLNVTSLAGLSFLAATELNLGASTGVTTIGDINSTAAVDIFGVKSPIATLNKAGGISRDTIIFFQSAVLNGANNALQINLDGVDGGDIDVTPDAPTSTNGYETFNVAVATPSTVGSLIAGPSLDNINVSGSALEIEGQAGLTAETTFNALEASLQSFNASAMTGPLIVGNIENGVSATEGASVVNAGAEDLNFVGSNNGTTLFVEAASLGQGDVLNGGAGAGGTLVLTGASSRVTENGLVQGNNGAFTATGFETLAITDTRGNGVGVRANNNPANFNLANVSGVNTVQLGTASSVVVGLTNLQYTSPLAINVTGNGESTVNAGNGVNAVFFGAFGDSDTVNYTFGNRGAALSSSVSTLTLGQLTLPNIENINLTFNDLNANTSLGYTVFGEPTPGTGTQLLANSSSARFVSVTSQSGDGDLDSIVLGVVGAAVNGVTGEGSVRGGQIASNAGVTASFNTRGGASIDVSGNGDHVLSITADGGTDASINASSATGDLGLLTVAPTVGANNGRVQLTGGTGDDTIAGGTVNDILTGNAGDDQLLGRGGTDVLSGGDNNDILIGGADADVLTGGSGEDDFIFTVTATSDAITDFSVAQIDQLVFDISLLGLSAGDYIPGGLTALTAAATAALATGGANNNVIVDTAANIAAFTNGGGEFVGAALAVATDTGAVLFDANADFSAGTLTIGTLSPAQAALLGAANLQAIA